MPNFNTVFNYKTKTTILFYSLSEKELQSWFENVFFFVVVQLILHFKEGGWRCHLKFFMAEVLNIRLHQLWTLFQVWNLICFWFTSNPTFSGCTWNLSRVWNKHLFLKLNLEEHFWTNGKIVFLLQYFDGVNGLITPTLCFCCF